MDDDLENCVWVLCLDHELLLYRNGGLKLFHHIPQNINSKFLDSPPSVHKNAGERQNRT